MALPTCSKTINGREYETTLLDAVKGRAVFLRLAKVLGSGASAAGEKIPKGTWAASVAGMAGAIERLSEEDLTYFSDTFALASTVQVDGGSRVSVRDVYAVHFAGKIREMLEWLLFCFESNYADFFGEAKSQLAEIWGLAMTQKESASPSPTESTGGSGDSSPTTESV